MIFPKHWKLIIPLVVLFVLVLACSVPTIISNSETDTTKPIGVGLQLTPNSGPVGQTAKLTYTADEIHKMQLRYSATFEQEIHTVNIDLVNGLSDPEGNYSATFKVPNVPTGSYTVYLWNDTGGGGLVDCREFRVTPTTTTVHDSPNNTCTQIP